MKLSDGAKGWIMWLIWVASFFYIGSYFPADEHGSRDFGEVVIVFLAVMPIIYLVYKILQKKF